MGALSPNSRGLMIRTIQHEAENGKATGDSYHRVIGFVHTDLLVIGRQQGHLVRPNGVSSLYHRAGLQDAAVFQSPANTTPCPSPDQRRPPTRPRRLLVRLLGIPLPNPLDGVREELLLG